MLIGFGVIGAILWLYPAIKAGDAGLIGWQGGPRQIVGVCLWAVGGGLWLLTLIAPMAAKPIYVGWMSVAVPIGIAVSTILLTLLYFILLPFFSIVVRMGDPVRRKLDPEGSYWEDHAPFEPSLDRMRRLF